MCYHSGHLTYSLFWTLIDTTPLIIFRKFSTQDILIPTPPHLSIMATSSNQDKSCTTKFHEPSQDCDFWAISVKSLHCIFKIENLKTWTKSTKPLHFYCVDIVKVSIAKLTFWKIEFFCNPQAINFWDFSNPRLLICKTFSKPLLFQTLVY